MAYQSDGASAKRLNTNDSYAGSMDSFASERYVVDSLKTVSHLLFIRMISSGEAGELRPDLLPNGDASIHD